jgi:high-affinity iron transporter
MEGMGQELFNATVLFLAVAMLGWHNIWMQRHGRELAAQMSAVGAAVSAGARPLYAVAIAVGLAVLREGSEVVLFLYGIASGGTAAVDLALGGAIGLGLGVLAAVALYAGLLRLSTKYLFVVTSWMILLLAAGMAAGCAKFLSQAGWLPSLGNTLWDTSWLLSESTPLGQVLHVLIGYVARPSGVQLAFYAGTIVIVGGLMLALNPRRRALPAGPTVAVIAILGLASLALPAREAQAHFKVYAPYVDYRELEIEYRGSRGVDADPTKDDAQKHLLGIGYGFTDWWSAEIYAEWARDPGDETVFDAFEFESLFRFTEPGEYWLDFGALVEFERTDASDDPDEIEAKLLFAKDFGKFSTAYNLSFVRQVGSGASDDVEFEHAFQLRYRLDPLFEPGIEIYGEFGPIDDMPDFDEQEHRIGPIVAGVLRLGDQGMKLKYNVGYLFALTDETEDGAVKAQLELEFPL